MTTNVPAISWLSTGPVVPTDAEILAGVIADFQAAFGTDMNPSLETPQGQLASSQAAIISDCYAQIVYLANMMDPNFAAGRFQDALGKIYFMSRIAAAGTVVQAQCSGKTGTPIPVGALAQDSSGNIYSCTTAGTIDGSGSATVSFTCQTTGPIACPSGALNTIYQSISGWDSITNSAAGAIGRYVETRSQFEYRRQNSVALNSVGPVAAVRAAVMAVAGVLDCYAYDNKTNSAATVGGVSIDANSIYVAVEGGDQNLVAAAILSKCSAGTPFTGTTSVTVYDSSYPDPQPSYDVKFTVPTDVPLYFAVNIRTDSLLPADINTLIQDAMIASTATGESAQFRIGYTVYAADFNDSVKSADTRVQVVSIKIGTAASPTGDYVDLNIDQFATISAANITVTQV